MFENGQNLVSSSSACHDKIQSGAETRATSGDFLSSIDTLSVIVLHRVQDLGGLYEGVTQSKATSTGGRGDKKSAMHSICRINLEHGMTEIAITRALEEACPLPEFPKHWDKSTEA